MVARRLLTASAVGLSLGLLAELATGAEVTAVRTAPPVAALVVAVDARALRDEIAGHSRELNRQLRTSLAEDLRRELGLKVVLAEQVPSTRS
jgi:hypothetical protein